MRFLKVLCINKKGFEVDMPTLKRIAFEDNAGMIQLASEPNLKEKY